MLFFSYFISFAFKTYEAVPRVMSMVFQFAAIIPAIPVMILTALSTSDRNVATYIHYVAASIGTSS
jgi:hypothetical protein